MSKPTSTKPPRHTTATRKPASTDKPSAKRPASAARRRRPRLPEIAQEPFRLTADRIIGMALTPAAMLLERSLKNAVDENLRNDPVRRRFADAHFLFETTLQLVLATGGLCVGATAWGVMKALAVAIAKLNRRKYLPREKERRRALARERRRIRRRTTLNVAPTAAELLEAWAHVRESPSNMIRFGSMLCDLEAYVDNSLIHDETGEICGRRPGIRGWLNDNCQELATKYKTVMGYKAMANKFRQAMGLADPYPAAMALDLAEAEEASRNAARKPNACGQDDTPAEADGVRQNTVWRSGGSGRSGKGDVGVEEEEAVRKAEAYRVTKSVDGWGEDWRQNMVRRTKAFLEDCGRSRRSVAAAIDVRVHPEAIPRIVEIAERREQGLPGKDGPAMRFAKMMA